MTSGIGLTPQNSTSEITHLTASQTTLPEKRCTTNTLGKTITGIGLIATTLFFGAPVIIPVSTGTLVGGVFFSCNSININSSNRSNGDASSLACISTVCGILFGIGAGVFVGTRTWQPTVDFVYNPHTVFIAAVIGASISGLGGTLWVGSSCCEKKN